MSRALGSAELRLWSCCALESALDSGLRVPGVAWDATTQRSQIQAAASGCHLAAETHFQTDYQVSSIRRFLRSQSAKKGTILVLGIVGIIERTKNLFPCHQP